MRRTCLFAAAVAIVPLVSSSGAVAEGERGYGPWQLGMSKTEVSAVAEFGPYKEVASTGGLETPNGVFEGRRTNISFVFGNGHLQKIQIWAYEGPSVDAAIDSWYRVREYLSRLYGPVETPWSQPAAEAGRRDFATAVNSALERQPQSGLVRLQIAPATRLKDVSVFSSFFRHSYGYFVFLYYQEP